MLIDPSSSVQNCSFSPLHCVPLFLNFIFLEGFSFPNLHTTHNTKLPHHLSLVASPTLFNSHPYPPATLYWPLSLCLFHPPLTFTHYLSLSTCLYDLSYCFPFFHSRSHCCPLTLLLSYSILLSYSYPHSHPLLPFPLPLLSRPRLSFFHPRLFHISSLAQLPLVSHCISYLQLLGLTTFRSCVSLFVWLCDFFYSVNGSRKNIKKKRKTIYSFTYFTFLYSTILWGPVQKLSLGILLPPLNHHPTLSITHNTVARHTKP